MIMLLRKKERLTNTEPLFLDRMVVVSYSLIFVFRRVFRKLISVNTRVDYITVNAVKGKWGRSK